MAGPGSPPLPARPRRWPGRLDEKRQAGAVICPPPEQVFAALRATPLADVRAVILGQDPYPTPGDAHGFAFSVPSCRPTPRSLKFIFDAYSADLGLPRPTNGDLTGWARRGVLLLNCIFTVESGSSNAHRHLGWEALAREVIGQIDARRDGVLFLLGAAMPKRSGAASTVAAMWWW